MEQSPEQNCKQVLLIFETSIKASRDKIKGIMKYEHLHGPWNVHHIEGRAGEQAVENVSDLGVSGIILESSMAWCEQEACRATSSASVPTVVFNPFSWCLDPHSLCFKSSAVIGDNEAIGRVGAEHFLELGFQHFAFACDVNQPNWSMMRRDAFVNRLAEEGYSCEVYAPATQEEKTDWGVELPRITAWLRSLPKPTGVMAAMDMRAKQVIDTCQSVGIQVPHDIAILGVDNDEMICESSHPPISSIVTDCEHGGYIAAEILDGLMSGRITEKQTATYGVVRVESRRSSDAIQVADAFVKRVLEHIWSNNGIGVSVADTARNFNVSLSFLGTRFKEVVGHSVINEIQRVRLEKIRTLVLDSDTSFSEIVNLCGLESESYLAALFKKKYNKTMTQFRRDRG